MSLGGLREQHIPGYTDPRWGLVLTASEKPTRAPHETWAHWKVASRNKESDHLSFRFGPPREGRFRRPIRPPLLRPSAIGVTCTSQECLAPQPGGPTQVCPGPCSFCASSWLLPLAAPRRGSACCEHCCEETLFPLQVTSLLSA